MEVLLELYTNTLTAARSWNFSVEKTSTFFSIIKRNHEEMAEAFLPAEKSWEYLKSLLLMHAVQRPPHSVGIFTLAELHRITDFALTHYYDHFKLYRYTFTLKHVKQVDVRSSWTELPPASFPSLSEGVPVEKTTEPEVPEQPPSPPKPIELPPIDVGDAVPAGVKEAVEEQIRSQVAAVQQMLEEQYADRAAKHEAQIAALESSLK